MAAISFDTSRTDVVDQWQLCNGLSDVGGFFLKRSKCRPIIDDRYINSPYYIAPDGQVGQDAFAVIRDTVAKMNMVALGRVVPALLTCFFVSS